MHCSFRVTLFRGENVEKLEYQQLFSTGTLALTAKEFGRAAAALESCYAFKTNFRTNYLLFLAMCGQKKFAAAFTLAQEYLREYISDNERFEKLLFAGAQAQKFIEIRKICTAVAPYMSATENKHFFTLLARQEAEFVKQQPVLYHKLKKEVVYCGSFDIFNQRTVWRKSHALPLADYLITVGFLLKDPNVHQLIKVNVLDDLRTLKVADEYELSFLDHKLYKIQPNKLHLFASSKLYQAFETSLLECNQDGLGQKRWEEVRLKLSLLYPFETQLVSFSKSWQRILLYEKEHLTAAEKLWANRLESSLTAWNI